MLNFDDVSQACQGWRSSDYQSYLNRVKDANESDLTYNGWNVSNNAGLLDEGSVDTSTVQQVVFVGGGAFIVLSALIVVIGFIAKRRKTNSLVKMYGVPFVPQTEKSAENEALEGTGGLSAQGGIMADSGWDDDIEDMDFSVQSDSPEEQTVVSSATDVSELYGGEDSLESIAGIEPTPSVQVAKDAPAMESTPSPPPIPDSGLPDGWTLDQWKWYGQEWLDKNQ
jgi:hypothetical protein